MIVNYFSNKKQRNFFSVFFLNVPVIVTLNNYYSLQDVGGGVGALGKRSRKRKRFPDEEPEAGGLKKKAIVRVASVDIATAIDPSRSRNRQKVSSAGNRF